MNVFYQFHVKILRCILFSPLFLLTFSRFICLYCNHFYQRHNSTVKIITFIIISNAFFIFLITIRSTYAFAVDEGRREREYYDAKRQCGFLNCPGWPPECNQTAIDMCVSQIPYLNPFWGSLLTVFEYAIPSMTLLLTIIFSCAMMYKVGKQLKFQAQQDHSPVLNSTIRITVICFIQTVTVTFIFLLTSVGNLRNIAFTFTGVNEYGIEKLYKEIIPLLFEEPFIRSLNQIRIFIDNIIVLLILNGYRKTLRNFFLIIFKIAKNPNKLLNIREMTTLFISSTTKVTAISLNSNNKSRKL